MSQLGGVTLNLSLLRHREIPKTLVTVQMLLTIRYGMAVINDFYYYYYTKKKQPSI